MNQQNVWHYLILAIGIVACLAAMYYVHGIENYNEKFKRLMEELIHIQKTFDKVVLLIRVIGNLRTVFSRIDFSNSNFQTIVLWIANS
jgi:hypothetical protein